MNNEKIIISPKRILKNDEVSKILNTISKYFYSPVFNIAIKNKVDKNNKMIISFLVKGEKNGENITISDNFII